jgi:hypothetical protein
MSAPLDEVDAELASWRDRLAAASRNVSELTELPEFAAARAAAGGSGRMAEAARGLVATADELWQGVLLLGGALERADHARKGGSRLWRGEETAQEVLAILRGPSIKVDLADAPVLHRRLLAGPRNTAVVSPDALLQAMDAGFDRAREGLARMAEASQREAALRARVTAALAKLPAPDLFAERLAVAGLPDPLDRLDALEGLATALEAAAAAIERGRAGLAAARRDLEAVQAAAAKAEAVAKACRAAILSALPPTDANAVAELAAWLDQIGRTLATGRADAAAIGLANWQKQRAQVAGAIQAVAESATSRLSRLDDLRARLPALRAKQRARATPGATLDALAEQARATLAAVPVDLDAAARDLAAYQSALARP